MNPRARHLRLWLAATLATALLVHFGTLYALPRLVMRRALKTMGEANSMHFGTRPTAASRVVVRPSPDILYASCPFDLSSGPLRGHRECATFDLLVSLRFRRRHQQLLRPQ